MNVQFFIEITKTIDEINADLTARKITTLEKLKKKYLELKNRILHTIDQDNSSKLNKGKLFELLAEQLEKSYHVSYDIFKEFCWGRFSKLNKAEYPELYELLVDKNGDLHRLHDDFSGTVAMMDFHGYTKFSNNVKYNKTPLLEFGEGIPTKIFTICKQCRSFVYELEGDSLIIIGPQNPYWVLSAVICIMELARQKNFFNENILRNRFGIELKNPTIQPFNMTASITTGGKIFINYHGNIVGSIISEASRILSIINQKKPSKPGIMVSNKISRILEKKKNEPQFFPINLNNLSNPYLIDVKGMRLKIQEFFLESQPYIKMCDFYTIELYKMLKIKNPSKWYNIIVLYTRLAMEVLKNVDVVVPFDEGDRNSSGLILILEEYIARWIDRPSADIARGLIDTINRIYSRSDDVRDVLAVYYEYINDSFILIISRLEKFYEDAISNERTKDKRFKSIYDTYSSETEKLKNRYFPRRVFETVLENSTLIDNMREIPYIGKK